MVNMEEILVEIKDIRKKYKQNEVLKGVDLKVLKNEKTALIGVNGGGKSTLLDIMCGVKKANGGNVVGVDRKKFNFGYMPQSFSMFGDLTVRENLEYLATVYNLDAESIEGVVKKCFLTEHINKLAKNLSGGYRQLLSLAGAIIHNPPLLIMDEPTSAMDPKFRDDFWKIIDNYVSAGGTVFTTTHHLDEIEYCDEVAILSGGKIVYFGDLKQIDSNSGFNSALELISFYTSGDSYDKKN